MEHELVENIEVSVSTGPSANTLNILGSLVAFDTVSARSNRALIDYVAEYLRGFGIEAEVLPSPDMAKASLWATVGPAVDGGVVLSGHSDVVPVEGQNWASDPFALSIRDGRAYGRGTADMKGFLACVLSMTPRLAQADLVRPVHIAITYDEEVGCIGAPELLSWLSGQPLRPAAAFIGEPTGMNVVNAHKGILVARTEITGVEAHSSLAHLGVSAIGLAGRAITLLQAIEAELAERHHDDRFEPARTTLSVNRIGGGTAVNILAGRTWFEWDIRTIPGIDAHTVLGQYNKRLQDEVINPLLDRFPTVDASTSVVADAPALAPEPEGEAEGLAKRLLRSNRVLAVPFAAEAGQFQRTGLSTVIIGPGSIDQAHTADEYIELEQLARCEQFLTRLRDEMLRPSCLHRQPHC